jgi:PAS domain S-box-containing protein
MSQEKKVYITGFFLTICIFITDLNTELGVAEGVPYIAVILIGIIIDQRKYFIVSGVAGVFLTIIGYYFSPAGGELWKILINRIYTVLVIIVTSTLCIWGNRKKSELKLAKEDLEYKVKQRTQTLESLNNSYELENQERKLVEKNLLETKQDLEIAQKITNVGNWVLEVRSSALTWSDEIYRIFGVSKEDFTPTYEGFLQLVHPDDREFVLKEVEAALKNIKPYDIQHRIIRPDGTERIVHEKSDLEFDEEGYPVKWIGAVQDITEQHRIQDQLRLSNVELEKFTYTASHDLQEPLRKVITFGDLLRETCSEKLTDKENNLIHRMQKASFRMKDLIDDLLSYSRLTHLENKFGPVNLNCIAQEIIEDLEVQISLVGGDIQVHSLPTIEADMVQMRQLFLNLVSNGLKYKKPDQPPKIIIKSFPGENNSHKISFIDNGIGIDCKYSDKIFDAFQRLDGDRNISGSGMGLFICKKIIARHRGTISVKSSLGKGSEFITTLPDKQEGANCDT